MNVLSRVSALDYEKSVMLELDEKVIDPLTGRPEVVSVWREALKADALVGHDIVRLVEFFPPLFVSERFVDLFWRSRFTGGDVSRSRSDIVRELSRGFSRCPERGGSERPG